ncbi:MAG TPA: TrkA family potassium uptake protein [Candidatus Rikenella faecigallinarum]|uniref:TrkA family potassium uptake protein n=1 Tax=Candidatus Rikenella faecigallinarum TaxID=2838745 RepID=A0A9D1QCG3_9BACT|nr:TrkA family potassium uptake protein [Candidatus Rikenella faecigallinarum]
MKYIIIGLGNFGSVLATRLTQMGHEVIGVDDHLARVNELRDSLSSTICMNASDTDALRTLPLDQVDMVIIAIGENFAASIQIVAQLRQMKVEHIVARALNELHRTVLQALGVDRIIFPEQEAAEVMAQSFELSGFLSSYQIDRDHYVMRFSLPPQLNGKSVGDSDIEQPGLRLLAVVRDHDERNSIGIHYNRKRALDTVNEETILQTGDIIVVYGTLAAYNTFTRNLREG